jgi:hypothetical protein
MDGTHQLYEEAALLLLLSIWNKYKIFSLHAINDVDTCALLPFYVRSFFPGP